MTTKSTDDELRKTGIDVIGEMPWGAHLCHFYETKDDLLDVLIPYFKAGLENNEFCIWVVADPLSEEEARNALRQAVPEADQYLAARRIEIVPHTLFPALPQWTPLGEQIEIIPHTDWYLKDGGFIAERVLNGWKQKLAEALASGYSGLRANGNEAWLTAENWKAFAEYERTLNENLAGQRMIVLCSYPVAKTEASGMLDVIHSHQFAIARRQGQWEVIESPEPIQAKAEIKRLNEALQRAKERRPKPLPILSYGVAVLSVTVALFVGRWMQINYGFEPFVLFLCAMMFSAWFGGFKPGLLALALSILAFHYYFLIPIYLLGPGKEIPRLLTATLTSFFVVWLSAAQRSKRESLTQARDVLNGTVQDLRRVNVALRAENAERKQAEEAVRDSQQLVRLVLETLPVGVSVINRAGDIVLVNDASKRIWGGTVVGGRERWEQTKAYWHDSGQRIAPENWASVRALSKGETSLNELIDIETYDGARKTIRNSVAPIRNDEGLIVGAVLVNEDVTDRVRAEKDLKDANRQLNLLSRRRIKIQEEERRHLARELHDEIGQELTAAKINLQAAIKESDGAKSKRIHETTAILERLLGQVRQISLNLRPSILDDLGLVPALRSLLDEQGRRASVAVHFSAKNMPKNLDPEIQTTFFRIGQEAITNAVRHANATQIDVDLGGENGNLRLQVHDNGRGFDVESVQAKAVGLGLIGIKERAAIVDARAKIISSPNKGTTVEVSLPLTSSSEREGREIGK